MKTLQRGVETKVVDLRRNFFPLQALFFPSINLRSAVICRIYEHSRARVTVIDVVGQVIT